MKNTNSYAWVIVNLYSITYTINVHRVHTILYIFMFGIVCCCKAQESRQVTKEGQDSEAKQGQYPHECGCQKPAIYYDHSIPF